MGVANQSGGLFAWMVMSYDSYPVSRALVVLEG
jgi:hypothetical protein